MKDTALIVIDMLYDFIDGSLACAGATEAVAKTAEFIGKIDAGQPGDDNEILGGYPVAFIADHHPANHCSFKDFGGIWPPHCVQGTHGGEIHSDLAAYATEEMTFYKGCDSAAEQYSGFEGINIAGQSLSEVLEILEISEVYVCGIATEYCVRNTCEDLLKAGFKVHLLKDCLGYVDIEGHRKAIGEMSAEGIIVE